MSFFSSLNDGLVIVLIVINNKFILHLILWHAWRLLTRYCLDFQCTLQLDRWNKASKELLVQKQAFLSSSAMLEFMLSGNINLLVLSMPELLSFYQDVTTFGAKTTEVPFRAGNPIIRMYSYGFSWDVLFWNYSVFLASIWSRLNPILEWVWPKLIILF